MSLAQGLAGAGQGMQQVNSGANPVWKAEMAKAIETVARRQLFFNADDCFEQFDQMSGETTRDNRAFGPAIVRARKAGLCKPTTTFTRSKRSNLHATDIRTWESLVFGKAL